jgi:uncharacterized membrane protein HdeD (DUF308 family)
MAKINRRFIDKHWLTFVLRGGLATIFGFLALFGGWTNINLVISVIVIYLLVMGIIDATGALYNSVKKHGWITSIIDALIDVATAVCLLFLAQGNLVACMVTLAVYTFVSGIIDIFHGFLSTVDPTDRFIRILSGVIGVVTGFVVLNAGSFEVMTFIRFFGAYLLIVGATSMVYGVHNRAQIIEDHVARSEARKASKSTKARTAKKKTRK